MDSAGGDDERAVRSRGAAAELLAASPADHGFDEAALDAIDAYIASDVPYLDSLLIIRHGYLVYESYHNGHDVTTLHAIASVTKSWTSALVGIAGAQGTLVKLDAALPALLPDYFADGAFADKREITLRHLLTMRSGIDYDENTLNSGGYGSPEDLLSRDVTAVALDFPVAHPPGEAWNYSTLDTQLISAIMRHATGQPLEAFAASNLFAPLGITEYEWLSDHAGTTIGGQNLQMAPRSMAKPGLLYLHNGMWAGEQLVPVGKHKTGKACLYLKTLKDVDMKVLREMIERSVRHRRETHPG